MLDIFITHYTEPWEICRKLFWSLDLQRRVNWDEIRVTVINDGGHRLPEEELARLSFRVQQLDIPHGGISAARNAGIMHAQEPWIMFCDCDDSFYNIYALEDIMGVLAAPGIGDRFDMMWTKVWEETEDSVFLIPAYRTFVFCHGKLYNRLFLLRNGMQFEETLDMNEDSCFNAVIIARTTNKRIGEIKSSAPVYSWIRRAGSVTALPEAHEKGMLCTLRRNLIVTEENRLHRPDQYANMVARTAYDAFYMMHSTVSASCKQQIMELFAPWISERLEEIGKVTPEMLEGIRNISRSELMEEEVRDSHEEIQAWIREAAQTA